MGLSTHDAESALSGAPQYPSHVEVPALPRYESVGHAAMYSCGARWNVEFYADASCRCSRPEALTSGVDHCLQHTDMHVSLHPLSAIHQHCPHLPFRTPCFPPQSDSSP